MRINEVEVRVGITKKNIRFYEQEGLLRPERNKENGYRNYSDADVDTLQKIKLLRKLSLPLEEIRLVQSRRLTLQDAIARHLITLEREQQNLKEICELCHVLSAGESAYDTLDAQAYLERMKDMEEKGVWFMNMSERDKKKKRSSLLAGGVFIALMLFFDGVLVWAYSTDIENAPPLPFMLVLWAIPLAVTAGVAVVMHQRIKEIEGGEENEARKY